MASTQNETGWARLEVETPATGVEDGLAAFAAGYVEAALTADLINMQWQNEGPTPDAGVLKFIEDNKNQFTNVSNLNLQRAEQIR